MPQGLGNFVKRQDQNNGIALPPTIDLTRRKQIAKGIKVKPTSGSRAPAQVQATSDHHSAHTYVQPSSGYEQGGGGLFDESTLDDSEDTSKDLDLVNVHGYQPIESPRSVWNLQSRARVEQTPESQFSDDTDGEGGYGNVTNLEGIEDDPDDKGGRRKGFQHASGAGSTRNLTLETLQEEALRLRDSQVYADAQKAYNSKLNLNSLPHIHPGISGRFTPAASLTSDIRQYHTEVDGMTGSPQTPHPQLNDGLLADDLASSDSDDHPHQGVSQHRRLEYGGHIRDVRQNNAKEERNSNGEKQAGDKFNGSKSESNSGGSRQSSPTQSTPRGNEPRKKQTPTSNQHNKRKIVDVELDYEVDILSTMKYSELKDQPFDSNPKPLPSVIPESLTGPEMSLERRLEYFRSQERTHQASFFAHMPMDQWEESGDWFLDRFGDIMAKLKGARQAKRDVSKVFEEELAVREEAVRAKSAGIQEILKQMRAGGEGVLRGRAP